MTKTIKKDSVLYSFYIYIATLKFYCLIQYLMEKKQFYNPFGHYYLYNL